ncbi:MAG: choline-binding transcriptional repressor BetI [Sagittula sp.]|jgi:TetR/AcrR family transcriptional regulator, transcriptional repressor of bet genes|uniref:choline-binding transcriptional repressor BetI n=2 Tax=Roseobacteraceae TaxID=2854170 RepID=UPI000C2D01CD|nr:MULTISPECIES: transcriptional regulator BetI [unclassified Sagittula]AUC54802.1 transcriptional regulator BetI [Sagittula sp. P11]WHZ33836.1 transcriptional regulator BetI [Sagittula sp. MA-2]
MPKLGQEPIRRRALVAATVAEIGAKGSLDVTVGQIAKRAGMSTALAHHYFGGKTDIFLAAMRHILSEYGAEVRAALATARKGRRLEALIEANFAESCFERPTISAWLSFYGMAQSEPGARRLLSVYHARLRSNLRHALRGRCKEPELVAEQIGALIDGVYLRAALSGRGIGGAADEVIRAAHALMHGPSEGRG